MTMDKITREDLKADEGQNVTFEAYAKACDKGKG